MSLFPLMISRIVSNSKFSLKGHSLFLGKGKIFLIKNCGTEPVLKKHSHPHSRLGEAGGVFVSPIGLLDIFSQCELDSFGCIFENQLIGRTPEPELDDRILSPNRIGRTVQKITSRHSTGQLSLNVYTF